MSAIKETFLLCDVCSLVFGSDTKSRNAEQQRNAAKNNGWVYSGNKDYCPGCRAKNKNGMIHKGISRPTKTIN